MMIWTIYSLQQESPNNTIKTFTTLQPRFHKKLLNKTRLFQKMPIHLRNKSRIWVSTTDQEKKLKHTNLEIETTIAKNIADIQADTIKNMTILEMKLSSITSNTSYSSDKPHTEQLKCMLLKTHDKYSYASQFTKYLYPLTLEYNTLLQI